MLVRHTSQQASLYRCAVFGAASIALLAVGIVLAGCGPNESNGSAKDDPADDMDYPLAASYFTTNGVPISIDIASPTLETPRKGIALVLAFPDDDGGEAANESENENDETEPAQVKMVFMVLPFDGDAKPDEPKEPVSQFKVEFPGNEDLNWIWVTRDDQSFPRKFDYRIRAREHLGQLPKPGYYSLAAKFVGEDESQTADALDNADEPEHKEVKLIGAFRYQ